MTDQTDSADRLEELRTEYAQTGSVMSGGAVWLISQVVVLREQVQRLTAAPGLSPAADRAALRDRIADALAAVLAECDAIEADYRDQRDEVAVGTRAAIIRIRARVAVPEQQPAVLPAPADRATMLRELADLQEATATTDVIRKRRSIATARRLFAVELRRMADEAQQDGAEAPDASEAPAVCGGFQWIGQSFATCERCGQPAWDHAGEEVAVEGAGLFDTRRTVRPWKPGQADAIRAKWGTPAVGAQQPKEAENPRSVCVCGHTRGEHLRVSGRLLCDVCVPDSTDNLVCKEFEAL